MSPEQRLALRARELERERQRFAALPPEAKAAFRQRKQLGTRRWKEERTAEQAEALKEADRQRYRRLQAVMNPEEKAAYRERMNLAMRRYKDRMTPEERIAFREKDKIKHRAAIAGMSDAEREDHRQQRAKTNRLYRQNNRVAYEKGGRISLLNKKWRRDHRDRVIASRQISRAKQKDSFFHVLGDLRKIADAATGMAAQVVAPNLPSAPL